MNSLLEDRKEAGAAGEGQSQPASPLHTIVQRIREAADELKITPEQRQQIRERLDEAAGIGKAAEACADAGQIEKGIEVVLDVEQLLYEVNTFLNAASLINRLSKEG